MAAAKKKKAELPRALVCTVRPDTERDGYRWRLAWRGRPKGWLITPPRMNIIHLKDAGWSGYPDWTYGEASGTEKTLPKAIQKAAEVMALNYRHQVQQELEQSYTSTAPEGRSELR